MSRRKRKRARREAIDENHDPNDPLQREIRGTMDLARIEREINHPDFQFDPSIHEGLANKLWLIFNNRLPEPPQRYRLIKDKDTGEINTIPLPSEWSERARLQSARIIAQLAGLNIKNRPRQVEHKHAHLHVDAEAVAERLARLAADVGSNGEVE